MTIVNRRAQGFHPDLRLVRVAGGILLVDGLLRTTGRGPARGRARPGRRLGIAEAALGLALLDRVPIEPATLYRTVAPVYDSLSKIWRDWLYRGPLVALDAAVVSALPGGGDVLDLGCGTGAVLERLLALQIRFHTYTGVDLSPEMLARARAKLSGMPGVRFEQLDICVGRLPEGPFDLVVSAWALEHLPLPGPAVAAARARLGPGGRVVLLFEVDGRGPRAWVLRRLWRFFAVTLVGEEDARTWPGLVSLRRLHGLGDLGPDVALAVLEGEPAPSPSPTASRAGSIEPLA